MKRLPGRPPLDAQDRSRSVSVRMPGQLYDDARALAEQQRVNIPEAIRRAIRHAIEDCRRRMSR